jgi:hypothetical protein
MILHYYRTHRSTDPLIDDVESMMYLPRCIEYSVPKCNIALARGKICIVSLKIRTLHISLKLGSTLLLLKGR